MSLSKLVTTNINNIKLANFPGTSAEFQNITKLTDTNQGAIFLAEITTTGEKVVIKVAHARLVEEGLNRSGKIVPEDFLKERENTILITRKLGTNEETHIVKALDSWDERNDEGRVIAYCLMMEFIPGGRDLFDVGAEVWDHFNRTKNPQTMRPWFPRVEFIFRQVVHGVSLLHQNGIVHLDLSPENIMIDENDCVWIIDLGTSECCVVDVDDEDEVDEIDDESFRFRGFRGKLPYAAPEVWAGCRYDGRAADVFSLGTTLLFLLCGVADPTRKELRSVQSKGLRQWLRKYRRNFVPSDGIELIERLLVYEAERPMVTELENDPYLVDVADLEDAIVGTLSLDAEDFHHSNDRFVAGQDALNLKKAVHV